MIMHVQAVDARPSFSSHVALVQGYSEASAMLNYSQMPSVVTGCSKVW